MNMAIKKVLGLCAIQLVISMVRSSSSSGEGLDIKRQLYGCGRECQKNRQRAQIVDVNYEQEPDYHVIEHDHSEYEDKSSHFTNFDESPIVGDKSFVEESTVVDQTVYDAALNKDEEN